MTRLSAGIARYRFGMPVLYVAAALLLSKHSPDVGRVIPFMLIGLAAYTIWYCWRLSEVWLDGDVLEVKGPGGSFRVPLADVSLLGETGGRRTARVVMLGLAHPVGRITKVRFIPTGDWDALAARKA